MAYTKLIPNYITIGASRFRGLGSYFSIEVWSYVDEPGRNNAGVIENLNNADRFPTKIVFIDFPFISISDYMQFVKETNVPEFTVSAYFFENQKVDTFRAYLQKDSEQKMVAFANKVGRVAVDAEGKFYDNGVEVIGIQNFKIQLTGTNVDMAQHIRTYKFFANGGSGTIPPLEGITGKLAQMPLSFGITRPGFKLVSWNTQANGQGISYALNEVFVFGLSDVELYAQWTVE